MATLQPPPFRTPMYDAGVMHPAWWQWFNQLFSQISSSSGDAGIDDVDPPTPYVSDLDALQQTVALLAGISAMNDELEKMMEGAQVGPRYEMDVAFDPMSYCGPRYEPE